MTARLEWEGSRASDIEGVHELSRLLIELNNQAERNHPFIVTLILRNDDSLSAGLGRTLSVLEFVAGSKNPPYYESVGAETVESTAVITFDLGGEPSEFPLSAAVPIELAMRALPSFYETGRLPEFITWREV